MHAAKQSCTPAASASTPCNVAVSGVAIRRLQSASRAVTPKPGMLAVIFCSPWSPWALQPERRRSRSCEWGAEVC